MYPVRQFQLRPTPHLHCFQLGPQAVSQVSSLMRMHMPMIHPCHEAESSELDKYKGKWADSVTEHNLLTLHDNSASNDNLAKRDAQKAATQIYEWNRIKSIHHVRQTKGKRGHSSV